MGFDENIEMVRLAFYQGTNFKWAFFRCSFGDWSDNRYNTAATSIQENDIKFCLQKVALGVIAMGF